MKTSLVSKVLFVIIVTDMAIHLSDGKPFFFNTPLSPEFEHEHPHISNAIKLVRWIKKAFGYCGSGQCEQHKSHSLSYQTAHSAHNDKYGYTHGHGHGYSYGPSTPVQVHNSYLPVVENQFAVGHSEHFGPTKKVIPHSCWRMFEWLCDMFY